MLRNVARCSVAAFALGIALPADAQVPAPFPRPGQPAGQAPAAPAPRPPVAAPQPPPLAPAPPAAPAAQPSDAPTEATLGVPLYPNAQYLESYDAGHGQRFHIFGSASDFAQIIGFYKSALRQRGELIFDEPPIQMFETGKFREESMGFPPSVTVKDYTWGGSEGYLNPKRDGSPARFKTIVQIVVAPGGAR